MSDLKQLMYGLCALGFFLLTGWALIVYGGNNVRAVTLWALALAGVSQFAAQINSGRAQGVAWALILLAMFFMVVGLFAFTVTLLGNQVGS